MDESKGWVVKGAISRVHTALGQTIRRHFLLHGWHQPNWSGPVPNWCQAF